MARPATMASPTRSTMAPHTPPSRWATAVLAVLFVGGCGARTPDDSASAALGVAALKSFYSSAPPPPCAYLPAYGAEFVEIDEHGQLLYHDGTVLLGRRLTADEVDALREQLEPVAGTPSLAGFHRQGTSGPGNAALLRVEAVEARIDAPGTDTRRWTDVPAALTRAFAALAALAHHGRPRTPRAVMLTVVPVDPEQDHCAGPSLPWRGGIDLARANRAVIEEAEAVRQLYLSQAARAPRWAVRYRQHERDYEVSVTPLTPVWRRRVFDKR